MPSRRKINGVSECWRHFAARIRVNRGRFRSIAGRIAVVAALGIGLAACESSPDSASSVREGAKRVNQLRREAEECFAKFERSNGQQLEYLECFAEKHRQTTEIYPSPQTCPDCYLNYGRGLRALGNYYRVLEEKLEAEILDVSRSEQARYRDAIERAIAKKQNYYSTSNTILEQYLAAFPDRQPIAHFWVAQHGYELGDYDKAVRYLERFASASPELNEVEEKEVERLRNLYKAAKDRADLSRASR
jgi:tetratricopeptide (TPR) repeat protein